MKFASSRLSWAQLFVLVILLNGCGPKGDGLVKHQVTGEVRINDVPRKGIMVALRHTDPKVTGNAAEPIAKTDENGKFSISTNGAADGAVEGEYIVTFGWFSLDGSKDFLKGNYSKPERSQYRIQIGKSDFVVPTFDLKAKPEDVNAALADQQLANTAP